MKKEVYTYQSSAEGLIHIQLEQPDRVQEKWKRDLYVIQYLAIGVTQDNEILNPPKAVYSGMPADDPNNPKMWMEDKGADIHFYMKQKELVTEGVYFVYLAVQIHEQERQNLQAIDHLGLQVNGTQIFERNGQDLPDFSGCLLCLLDVKSNLVIPLMDHEVNAENLFHIIQSTSVDIIDEAPIAANIQERSAAELYQNLPDYPFWGLYLRKGSSKLIAFHAHIYGKEEKDGMFVLDKSGSHHGVQRYYRRDGIFFRFDLETLRQHCSRVEIIAKISTTSSRVLKKIGADWFPLDLKEELTSYVIDLSDIQEKSKKGLYSIASFDVQTAQLYTKNRFSENQKGHFSKPPKNPDELLRTIAKSVVQEDSLEKTSFLFSRRYDSKKIHLHGDIAARLTGVQLLNAGEEAVEHVHEANENTKTNVVRLQKMIGYDDILRIDFNMKRGQ